MIKKAFERTKAALSPRTRRETNKSNGNGASKTIWLCNQFDFLQWGIEACRLNAVTTKLYDNARKAIANGWPDGPFRGASSLVKDLTSAVVVVKMT